MTTINIYEGKETVRAWQNGTKIDTAYVQTKQFPNREIADAYIEGLFDGAGWDEVAIDDIEEDLEIDISIKSIGITQHKRRINMNDV